MSIHLIIHHALRDGQRKHLAGRSLERLIVQRLGDMTPAEVRTASRIFRSVIYPITRPRQRELPLQPAPDRLGVR